MLSPQYILESGISVLQQGVKWLKFTNVSGHVSPIIWISEEWLVQVVLLNM
jgi:hypothetical protein